MLVFRRSATPTYIEENYLCKSHLIRNAVNHAGYFAIFSVVIQHTLVCWSGSRRMNFGVQAPQGMFRLCILPHLRS